MQTLSCAKLAAGIWNGRLSVGFCYAVSKESSTYNESTKFCLFQISLFWKQLMDRSRDFFALVPRHHTGSLVYSNEGKTIGTPWA